MPPTVTMAQIAERCGVSRPTVSYALNGRDNFVSPEVAARIRQTALELGYQPHTAAQSLRRGSFRTLSLLYGAHSYLPKEFLDALIEGAAERHIRIDLTNVDHRRLGDPGYQPDVLRTRFADGVLLDDGGTAPDEIVRRLESGGRPTVTVNWLRPHNTVLPDDRQGGRRAAEILLAYGHRSAACVVQKINHFSMAERRDGFIETFRAGGGAVDVFDQEGGGPSLWRTLHAYFRNPARPTALFATSEFMGTVAGGAAMAAGLRPCGDLSVIAIADHRFAGWGSETSCLLTPWSTVATAALHLLAHRLGDPERRAMPAQRIPYGEPTALNTLGPPPIA